MAIHFFTSLKHLKTNFLIDHHSFSCQKVWILSHLSDSFDVPAGCYGGEPPPVELSTMNICKEQRI